MEDKQKTTRKGDASRIKISWDKHRLPDCSGLTTWRLSHYEHSLTLIIISVLIWDDAYALGCPRTYVCLHFTCWYQVCWKRWPMGKLLPKIWLKSLDDALQNVHSKKTKYYYLLLIGFLIALGLTTLPHASHTAILCALWYCDTCSFYAFEIWIHHTKIEFLFYIHFTI